MYTVGLSLGRKQYVLDFYFFHSIFDKLKCRIFLGIQKLAWKRTSQLYFDFGKYSLNASILWNYI